MSTFHVGQRVRVVGAIRAHRYIGCAATVIGPLEPVTRYEADGSSTSWSGHAIAIDGVGEKEADGWFCFRPEFLEPLTNYDGNTVVSWSECLWQPEGVSA